MRVPPTIVPGAKIAIVGEAPGADEVRLGAPFVGASGSLLSSMLHEAGILRNDCTITNVCPIRPPNNEIKHFFLDKSMTKPGPEIIAGMADLRELLDRTRPNLVIACGRTALLALTEETSIGDWRGSTMECTLVPGLKVIPIYHPAAILRMFEWKAITVHDLRRCAQESMFPERIIPEWNFILEPTADTVLSTLRSLRGKVLAADIETIARHIACLGLAWSPLEAICIPFARQGGAPIWDAEVEAEIIMEIQLLLTDPATTVIWQNGLYDTQHFAKHLGFLPNHSHDTMIAQSVLFPGLPKSLDFLSSMYCSNHIYWKDDLKDYNKYPTDIHKFWNYNAVDCCRTFEIHSVLLPLLDQSNLRPQYEFQMELTRGATMRTMLRGIAIDRKYRASLAAEVITAISERQNYIDYIAGAPINTSSPKQMQALFYDDLKMPVQHNRKSGNASLDDAALEKISLREPLLRDFIGLIQEKRSLGVFLSTFIEMPLDVDLRMRTSFNPAGTETFRFSSSENAFGSGGNLQNIPRVE